MVKTAWSLVAKTVEVLQVAVVPRTLGVLSGRAAGVFLVALFACRKMR